MNYLKFALNKPSELNRWLTHEGLSCTMAENSPSAYILERKIVRLFNKSLTSPHLRISKQHIKFANEHWVQNKLNKISCCERLEKLYAVLSGSVDDFIQQLSKIKA